MRLHSSTSLAAALALALLLIASPPAEAGWKAGLAKSDLTPRADVWLAGYGSRRVATEIIHPLWMKALALDDGQGHRVVLITSDFQGVPKGMSDRVFQQVKQRYRLERDQVMYTFSHNHCGPRLGEDLIDYYPVEEAQEELVRRYTDKMVTVSVELIGRALADLKPATIHTTAGRSTFGVNRRNNREADVPALLAAGKELVGPVDHTVPVMTVTGKDNTLRAILFGYACHPTTLSFTKWCGDYPGFAQVEIEKKHPGALAMFVNTCGGDQNPLPRRKIELCRKYGHMLAVGVEEALAKKPLRPVAPGLKTAFEYVPLAYQKLVTREMLTKAQKSNNSIERRWATRLLGKLDNGAKFSPTYPYPIHAWRLGKDTLMIGMGAETVVDFALRFKNEFGQRTWVCGYADDMISYIPSRRVWEEGGYEGGARLYEYGRPAYRWAGDVEKRIAASVHKLVKQVSK